MRSTWAKCATCGAATYICAKHGCVYFQDVMVHLGLTREQFMTIAVNKRDNIYNRAVREVRKSRSKKTA